MNTGSQSRSSLATTSQSQQRTSPRNSTRKPAASHDSAAANSSQPFGSIGMGLNNLSSSLGSASGGSGALSIGSGGSGSLAKGQSQSLRNPYSTTTTNSSSLPQNTAFFPFATTSTLSIGLANSSTASNASSTSPMMPRRPSDPDFGPLVFAMDDLNVLSPKATVNNEFPEHQQQQQQQPDTQKQQHQFLINLFASTLSQQQQHPIPQRYNSINMDEELSQYFNVEDTEETTATATAAAATAPSASFVAPSAVRSGGFLFPPIQTPTYSMSAPTPRVFSFSNVVAADEDAFGSHDDNDAVPAGSLASSVFSTLLMEAMERNEERPPSPPLDLGEGWEGVAAAAATAATGSGGGGGISISLGKRAGAGGGGGADVGDLFGYVGSSRVREARAAEAADGNSVTTTVGFHESQRRKVVDSEDEDEDDDGEEDEEEDYEDYEYDNMESSTISMGGNQLYSSSFNHPVVNSRTENGFGNGLLFPGDVDKRRQSWSGVDSFKEHFAKQQQQQQQQSALGTFQKDELARAKQLQQLQLQQEKEAATSDHFRKQSLRAQEKEKQSDHDNSGGVVMQQRDSSMSGLSARLKQQKAPSPAHSTSAATASTTTVTTSSTEYENDGHGAESAEDDDPDSLESSPPLSPNMDQDWAPGIIIPNTANSSSSNTKAFRGVGHSRVSLSPQSSTLHRTSVSASNTSGGHAGGNRSRDYQCSVCRKWFLRRQDLRRHEVTHSKVKAFACPLGCGTTFGRSDALSRHLKARRCMQNTKE